MKSKAFITALASTLLIGFTACSGAAKTENEESKEPQKTEIMEKTGNEWDVLMDETEALIKDLYQNLAPKVRAGDQSLIKEYAEKNSTLIDNIQKLDSCKEKMTKAQNQRLTEIFEEMEKEDEAREERMKNK